MPIKVQAFPFGLTSLLDIYGGSAPRELADVVVGQIDFTPMYNARLLTTAQAGPTGGLAALNAQVQLTVPQGIAWDVVGASFSCLLAAAAVVPSLELNVNGCAVAFIPGTDAVRANPYEHTVSYVPPGLVLTPGMTITGVIRSTPNSAITGIVRALVRQFSVGASTV